MNDELTRDLLVNAGRAVPVGSAPVAAVVQRARREQHRRRAALMAAAAVLVVAATATAVTLTGRETTPSPVVPPSGQTGLTWWTDGTLHLGDASVPAPGLVALADPGPGVGYVDDSDRVVYVADDGTPKVIGSVYEDDESSGHGRLTADVETSSLLWLDEAEGDLELVLYDVVTGETTTQPYLAGTWAPASSGGFVIALEGGVGYFDTRQGNAAWDSATGEISQLSRASWLMDVEGTLQVTMVGKGLTGMAVSDEMGERWRTENEGGTWATVSPDGRWLLRHSLAESRPGVARVFDAATGRTIRTGLPPDSVVVDAAVGSDATVTYAVLVADPEHSDAYQLISCNLPAGSCRTVVDLPPGDGAPVLPD